jgi:hypothetical protein
MASNLHRAIYAVAMILALALIGMESPNNLLGDAILDAALFAFCIPLVRWPARVWQYVGIVALAVGLSAIHRHFIADENPIRGWLTLTAVGVYVIWLLTRRVGSPRT